MKRIDFITNGKGKIKKEDPKFNQKRLNRSIEKANDYLDEKIANSEEAAIRAIEEIQSVITDEDAIGKKLQRYVELYEERDAYLKAKEYLKSLDNLLQEDIETEDDVKKVQVVG